MRYFKKRRLIRSILYSPLTASVLLLAIFFALHAVWNISTTYLQVRQNYDVAHKEYSELVKRKENIEAKVEQLSTKRGVETEIRNKFGFVKSGEQVIVIAEPPVGLEGNVINGVSGNALDIFNFIFDIFR